MEGLNVYEVMKGLASKWIENQKRNPGDYEDPDGFLICGKCGEPRQRMMPFPNPTEDDPSHTDYIFTTAQCRCEREEKERERQAKQAEKDMEQIKGLRKMSLMDDKFASATFDQLQLTKHNARNLKFCQRYAEKFDTMLKKNQGLIMWGDVGTGKSFAAACIANYLLERKVPVVMTSFVKLLEVIQSGKEQESEILLRLNRAKLIIFDDLGAERGTDYALEKVYNIVDSRYRRKLPMILTTNLTLDEMKKEDDMRYSRIYDRIFELCYPMQFTGPSWRKREASRRFDEMAKLLEED